MTKRKSKRKGGVLNFFQGLDNAYKRMGAWATRLAHRRKRAGRGVIKKGGFFLPWAIKGVVDIATNHKRGKGYCQRSGGHGTGTKGNPLSKGRNIWADYDPANGKIPWEIVAGRF